MFVKYYVWIFPAVVPVSEQCERERQAEWTFVNLILIILIDLVLNFLACGVEKHKIKIKNWFRCFFKYNC